VIKIRIIPSTATKKAIRLREEEIVEKKKKQQDYLTKRRMAQAQLLEVVNFDLQKFQPPEQQQQQQSQEQNLAADSSLVQNSVDDLESKVSGATLNAASQFATQSKQSEPSSLLSHNPNLDDQKQYELIFTAQRSWYSQSIDLIPGEYMIYVSVEFALSYQEIRRKSLPRDLTEAPWVNPKLASYLLHENKPEDFSAKHYLNLQQQNAINKSMSNDNESVHSLTSLKELEKKLFSQKNVSASLAELLVKEEEEKQSLLQHRVWLETSTLHKLQLKPINSSSSSSSYPPPSPTTSIFIEKKFDVSEPLFPAFVERDQWLFSTESQMDVSSMKLYSSLTTLREESELLAEEFINIARRYKEERKQELSKPPPQPQPMKMRDRNRKI
jgi:hypothetical protein